MSFCHLKIAQRFEPCRPTPSVLSSGSRHKVMTHHAKLIYKRSCYFISLALFLLICSPADASWRKNKVLVQLSFNAPAPQNNRFTMVGKWKLNRTPLIMVQLLSSYWQPCISSAFQICTLVWQRTNICLYLLSSQGNIILLYIQLTSGICWHIRILHHTKF